MTAQNGNGGPDRATLEQAAAVLKGMKAEARRQRHAAQRDANAHLRDIAATSRARASEERDRAAESYTQSLGKLEGDAAKLLRLLNDMRRRSTEDRTHSAADRAAAGGDRRAASRDRRAARAALELSSLDELTGAFRRGAGEHALQYEIARARRARAGLVVAFVDVDGLKEKNDHHGHAAGDELLREVVACIRTKLRPYDPVVRTGGDEFVCALPDLDIDQARKRFEDVGLELTHGSISVGLSELRPGDTVDEIVERADRDLRRTRSRFRHSAS